VNYLDLRPWCVRPGVRPGGASQGLSPGADAGPAAPQAPPWSKYGSIRQAGRYGARGADV